MDAPKRAGLFLVAAGIVAMISGIGWGVFFVGVPYPDPTPAQRAEEAFHLQVSSIGMLVGVVAIISSVVVFVVRWLVRLRALA